MGSDKRNKKIEEEISKQMDQIDRKFDRGGWFYMMIVILLLFVGVYVLIDWFRIPADERNYNDEAHQSLVERVDELESRLDEYELQLDESDN